MSAQPQALAPRFDVVALATSAGGLDAITAVLADFPADFAAAVVVGQHLGAESALVEVLQRRLRLRVAWAVDGGTLAPGCVHVCPPHMRMEVLPDGTCSLSRVHGGVLAEKPLDALLSSLADSIGARALAIVLTGMGRDGAAGARALRAAGGAVLVQSEASAAFPEMPRAAIEEDGADLVLPLADIGRTVLDLMAGGRFPQPRNEEEALQALFAGPGGAREALRRVDWEGTTPGPVLQWPGALKAVVATVLHSDFPMCIMWGEDYVQIYNDAWISVLGQRHPAAAGAPARLTWSEHWATTVIDLRHVLQTGEPRTMADYRADTRRDGFLEEAYFTASRSPLFDDRGEVGGVLVVLMERTRSVLAERRLGTLRSVAAAAAEQVSATCRRAAAALQENPLDVPFALFYMLDAARTRANLCASAGLRMGSPPAPHAMELYGPEGIWPLGRVARQGQSLVLEGLAPRVAAFHAGWDEPADAAILFPLRTSGPEPSVVMVLGLSPRLKLDAEYRNFAEMVAQQVEANLAEAQQRERERQRLQQLAELDRARTEFFSNVSHEFRTPLTLLLGPLEDLLSARDAAALPLRRELETAARNARRLVNLVDTLLDFSQIEAGRLRASFQPTDLAALTLDVASLFRSAIEGAGLRLDVDCPPLPQRVRVDAGMWEKIVSNLLSNALKFTFEGVIAVRLRQLEQHVELTVSDTGGGIPEEELANIFHRFHRVRGTRARTEEGAGIGLALVHDLVALHHGRIRVRSRPGEGSTFTVWLNLQMPQGVPAPGSAPGEAPPPRPVARQLAEEAARWTEGPPPPADIAEGMLGPADATLPVHVPGARILVADDNADMRDYLARVLGAHWSVTPVADGAEALALARAQRPDLVLTDVMMPGLDGFALLRELRADNELRATPLVLVTARAHEEAAIEARLAGADDYLAKPFSSRELVARVGAQLELARVRRQGERQVRELLALMPVGVYACDRTGRFEYWNHRAVELWGAEPQPEDRDWALRGAQRVLAPDSGWLAAGDAPMAEALRTGVAVLDHEMVVVRADGARIETLLNIRPLRDPAGQVSGAVAVFLDVTARKLAERTLQSFNDELEERVTERTAALRESEHRLALAFATLPVGIGIIDGSGATVMFNQEIRRFMPTGIIPSRDAARVARWRCWDAAGRPVAPEDFPAARALRGEDVLAGMQMLYLEDDGRETWIEVRSAPLRDDAGCITGALLVVIDVDRLKRGEEAAPGDEERQPSCWS